MSGVVLLEVFLCFLLIGVMGYAFILNRHIVVLRAGQDDFKSLMDTFNHALNQAMQTTQDLKRVAGAEQEKLAEKIQSSHKMCEELEFLIGRSETLLRALEKKNKDDMKPDQSLARERVAPTPIKREHSGRTDIQGVESSQNDKDKIFKTLQGLR